MAMLRNTGVRSETGSSGALLFAFHQVVGGHIDGFADVFHRPVVEPDILHHAAATAPAFDAHADGGFPAGDVVRHHVADAAGNFTAQRDRAMRVMHRAIRDGHVLRRPVDPPSVGVLAGFEHDAVVAGVNVTIGNPHVAAGINGDAVGMHARIGFDDDVLDDRVVRVQQVNRPHGGADKVNALDQHVRAVHEADERGPEFRRRLLVILVRRGRFHFQILQRRSQLGPLAEPGSSPEALVRGMSLSHSALSVVRTPRPVMVTLCRSCPPINGTGVRHSMPCCRPRVNGSLSPGNAAWPRHPGGARGRSPAQSAR